VAKVYLSSAEEDLELARDVRRRLDEAGHEVVLDQDPGAETVVGEQWEQQLNKRLRWADAVVCVITSASVASSRCAADIAMGQLQGSRLLPVRAEPEVNHPLLAEVQHTDLTQDPATAWAALIEALRRIDAPGDAGWPDNGCPFPGLRPFEIDQHRVFFGRDREIKALTERVRSGNGGAVLLVVGPSGCGKSSLVRAGLLAVMADEPGWRTLPPILPGADPVTILAGELATAARRIGLNWTEEHVKRRFNTGGFARLADELLLADPHGPQRRLLIVLDQFEELLTLTPPQQRARFAELLHPALSAPVTVVGTLRPEFLDPLLSDPDLAVLPTTIFALRPLHREALRLVITKPAQRAGIDVPDRLVTRLVEDTGSGEALPLLAFTLAQLASGVSRGEQLSADRYEQLGGVPGALIHQADAALAEALSCTGRSGEDVIAALLWLVTVDEQARPTRWRIRRDELPAAVVAQLDAFVTRRLLTIDSDHATVSDPANVVIGVTHEAFLYAWPPLAQAISANVTALRARRAVEQAAAEWHATDRPLSRLWGGDQLAAAINKIGTQPRVSSASPPRRRDPARWLPWQDRGSVTECLNLSTQAQDFLHASIRHDRFRRRRTATVLSVLLILALAAAGRAVVLQRDAQEGQRIATADQLVDAAEAARSTDLHTALLLGLAAHQLHPSHETHSSLVNTLATGPYLGTLTGHRGAVETIAFAPDGHTMATGSSDTTVILWDLTNPSQPHRVGQPLTGHSKPVNSVAFAPDNRTLATGSDDNTVILWDLTDMTRPRQLGSPLTGHSHPVNSVAFTPDGRTLATGSDDATVILWDLTDRTQPRRLGLLPVGHTGPITAVTWTPDGHILITGSADHTVILWDLTDRIQPRRLGSALQLPRSPLPFPRSPSSSTFTPTVSLALSSDGHTLIVSGKEIGSALRWDLADPTRPRQLGSLPSNVDYVSNVLALAPDGKSMATGDVDGTTALWDLTDPIQPRPLGQPLIGHRSSANVVAFAPQGHILVVGSDDGTTILWDLANPVQPRRLSPALTSHNSPVRRVVFAPDGHTLVVGNDDETVMLWDITDPVRPQRLGPLRTGHSGLAWLSVAFAPDGRTLATGSVEGTVILWDVTDRAQPRRLSTPLTGHSSGVWSVAFAPDGRTVAIGGAEGTEGTVILWDVTDRAQPHRLGVPLTGHPGGVWSVAFAPDGRTLTTGFTDGTVILWDVTDPTQPHRLGAPLTGHTGPVPVAAFAPDGRTLATGSADGTAILWDVTDRTRPHRRDPPLISGTLTVWSVAFAPDGRTVAIGGGPNVTLWDVTDPAEPHPLGPPIVSFTGSAMAVAFASDEPTLAVGYLNGTATLWDLTNLYAIRDHPQERACSITHGGLDRNEWHRRIPDLPYQHTCPA
jgi:WD40 repeat protein/energy-coupling factor transporter ATP-binding protein EcfA2